MTGYKIKELYKLLEALIDDGYGNREFQLSYDGDLVYTTIPKGSRVLVPKGSRVLVLSKAIRFTDYDDGTCHIDDLEEILND